MIVHACKRIEQLQHFEMPRWTSHGVVILVVVVVMMVVAAAAAVSAMVVGDGDIRRRWRWRFLFMSNAYSVAVRPLSASLQASVLNFPAFSDEDTQNL